LFKAKAYFELKNREQIAGDWKAALTPLLLMFLCFMISTVSYIIFANQSPKPFNLLPQKHFSIIAE